MNYPYQCAECGHRFDVIKSVKVIDEIEECPECKAQCDSSCRKISQSQAIDKTAAADWNGQHYSPALGRPVSGLRELRKEAKQRGWEEVGTEPAESVNKHFEKQREEKWQRSYDEINMNLGEVRSGQST